MRIKLLKKHNGTAKGSVLNAPTARADYLIRMGVAEKFIEPKAKPEPKEAPKAKPEPKEAPKAKSEPKAKKQPPKK